MLIGPRVQIILFFNMKIFIVAVAVLAVAHNARSAPAGDEAKAEILRYDNDINPDGSYSYVVETNNGISAQAQGTLRDYGGNPPLSNIVVDGAFAWPAPEGQKIVITYKADENGYQPSGDAIPTPPPIPHYILRALEYIAKNLKKVE